MEKKTQPLILVFYLDREMMQNKNIIKPFADSINRIIEQKGANIISLFIPTDGEEHVECINPVTVGEADMVKINKMINDIKTSFSIDDKSIVTEEITPSENTCKCGFGEKCECGNSI